MTKPRWSQVFATAMLILFLLSTTVISGAAPASQDGGLTGKDSRQSKVEFALQVALETENQANLFIMFDQKADLSPAYGMSWQARGEFVYETLKETAERNQTRVRAFLDARDIPYRASAISISW